MDSFCSYPIGEFKKLRKDVWIDTMVKAHHEYEKDYPNRPLSDDQIFAWKDEFDVLQKVLKDFDRPDFYIIFEYILYNENGCRPDVLFLNGQDIFVLEFKHKNKVLEADVAQADMYNRFISTCHMQSREMNITACLVLTTAEPETHKRNGSLHIVSPSTLSDLLSSVDNIESPIDIDRWQKSKYEPDKNALERMVDMFEHGKLPHLKTAKSSMIPKALTFIKKKTIQAKQQREHWLIVVSGVPGAGKTLLGVQYIYEARKALPLARATYVSGNGPLLKVLQGQLKYPTFLMGAPSFVKSYTQGRLNENSIVVFDEAQRMWSEEQMSKKNRGNFSENKQIVNIMNQSEWGILVALIGEGQEIYAGEDGGIKAWVEAVPDTWKVAYSSKYEADFAQSKAKEKEKEVSLDLQVSIRSQGAEDVSDFVNLLLDNHIVEAKELYKKIKQNHFRFYVTQNFKAAKLFCHDLYKDRPDKRYGCITSSQNPKVQRLDIAQWFNNEATSPNSCCQMKVATSEFDVEGLELDLPIVGWYDDLRWEENTWVPYRRPWKDKPLAKCQQGTPEYQYRVNTYRVLLTRGRDGVIIWVPQRLNTVYELLKNIGLDEIN